MHYAALGLSASCLAAACSFARAQAPAQVAEIVTRPGVTQRLLVLMPSQPRATVLLFTGGNGIEPEVVRQIASWVLAS